MIRRLVVSALLAAACALAQSPVRDLAASVLSSGLDPNECYQVRELHFAREDARFYLTEGLLIFGKPVNGRRLFAVFTTAGVEGGDAELLVMPPHMSERLSLASFTNSPNLEEHFTSSIMLFSDGTYEEMLKLLAGRGELRKRPERGAELAREWQPIVRNITRSFQVRILKDLLAGQQPEDGFFYCTLVGRHLGNFDFFFDPRLPEQISIGQVATRNSRSFFDLWTRFQARSFRNHTRALPVEDALASSYRIEARLDRELKLDAVTTALVTPGRDATHAIEFSISPKMRITAARIQGEAAEVFTPEPGASEQTADEVGHPVLIIPAHPLEAGHEYAIELNHSGSVITDAGNGAYYVGARGSWYPHRFPQFARYDLTFRYPKDMDLVATGKLIDQSSEEEWRVAHYRIETPVRLAGFNLGRFDHRSVTRGGYTVDVYANRSQEPQRAQQPLSVVIPPPGDRRWTVDLAPFPEPQPRDPLQRLEQLALEIASGLEFMAGYFGPPVLKTLTVSPIPGTFGQGFPGLIYLSTLAYLDPRNRPPELQTDLQRLFYSDIMHAHETAHQWWGNLVASAGQEDDWLMEALANYSALLYIEKHKGGKAVDQVLADYRARLLTVTPAGGTVDSTGPIIWGERLRMSKTPIAWRVITYEKGSWIIHMLRRRLGDDKFLEMLGEVRRRYQYKTINTDQFRAVMAEGLPASSFDPQLESFFEQWVYSTGIPDLRMTWRAQGAAPSVRVTGTIVQSGVPEDYSTWVPVEVQFAKAKPVVRWIRTAAGSVPFSIPVRQAPVRVLLDPANSVLRK